MNKPYCSLSGAMPQLRDGVVTQLGCFAQSDQNSDIMGLHFRQRGCSCLWIDPSLAGGRDPKSWPA